MNFRAILTEWHVLGTGGYFKRHLDLKFAIRIYCLY